MAQQHVDAVAAACGAGAELRREIEQLRRQGQNPGPLIIPLEAPRRRRAVFGRHGIQRASRRRRRRRSRADRHADEPPILHPELPPSPPPLVPPQPEPVLPPVLQREPVVPPVLQREPVVPPVAQPEQVVPPVAQPEPVPPVEVVFELDMRGLLESPREDLLIGLQALFEEAYDRATVRENVPQPPLQIPPQPVLVPPPNVHVSIQQVAVGIYPLVRRASHTNRDVVVQPPSSTNTLDFDDEVEMTTSLYERFLHTHQGYLSNITASWFRGPVMVEEVSSTTGSSRR